MRNISLPKFLIPIFRTNHAGETGAVYIYKAILKISNDREVLDFSKKHLKTESEHLRLIEKILSKQDRSKLIILWKVAGFLTGFIPALFGKKFIFATIFYVESFVEKHYEEQLEILKNKKQYLHIVKLIKKLQEDEVSHKDEALLAASKFNKIHNAWGSFIGIGSEFAVKISKKI